MTDFTSASIALEEFENVIEDLGNYEGYGLVTDEMLDALTKAHLKRHPENAHLFEP